MTDDQNYNIGDMVALTLEATRSRADMSSADKQLLDNAFNVAFMAALSATKQTGVKTSIALYHIGATMNQKAIEQYVKERSD